MKKHTTHKNILYILLVTVIMFGCSNISNSVNNNKLKLDDSQLQANKFFHFTISDEYFELSKEEIEKDYLLGGKKNETIEDRDKKRRELSELRVFWKNKKRDILMEDGNFLNESITIVPSPWEPSPEILTILKENFEQVMNSDFTGNTELLDYGTKKYDNVYYVYIISKSNYRISSNKLKSRISHQYLIKLKNNSFLITINTFDNVKFDDLFTNN